MGGLGDSELHLLASLGFNVLPCIDKRFINTPSAIRSVLGLSFLGIIEDITFFKIFENIVLLFKMGNRDIPAYYKMVSVIKTIGEDC